MQVTSVLKRAPSTVLTQFERLVCVRLNSMGKERGWHVPQPFQGPLQSLLQQKGENNQYSPNTPGRNDAGEMMNEELNE